MPKQQPGSDEMFRELADTSRIKVDVRVDDRHRAVEEWRVAHISEAGDEPGEQHPDPDETPSGDPPEYDPLPPPAP